MTKPGTAAVILAAGMGTRMKSNLPKVLHPLAGRPMISHLMASVSVLEPDRVSVVVAPHMDRVAETVAPATVVIQDPPLGTGHAVMAAREALEGFSGDVLVLIGDAPLVTTATLEGLLAARRSAGDPAVVVLGFRPEDAAQYGRMITDGSANLLEIVEYKDATPEQRAVGLCNAGIMAFDGARLFELLDAVGNHNANEEYYLTDVVAIARGKGWTCTFAEASANEVLGINSRAQLASAEAIVQRRLRAMAMNGGATLIDPATVWFSHDTKLGRDVTIEPHVVFGPGVTVADTVTIKGFSHLEGATVASGATVGPYARLRPGAEIGVGARVGNFVEIKKAVVEQGAKVNHLTYIGDARVGAGANIGAGTITCNYDGFGKYHTDIGAGAFIGSNSALVAPVKIGDGAIVGAGSVISRDVPGDALGLTRAEQRQSDGWAARFRNSKSKGGTAGK